MLGDIAEFDQLVETYYRGWWRLFPSIGSRAGLYSCDGELEIPTRELIEARAKQITPPESSRRFLRRRAGPVAP